MPVTDKSGTTEYTSFDSVWQSIKVPFGYSAEVFNTGYFTDLKKEFTASYNSHGYMEC